MTISVTNVSLGNLALNSIRKEFAPASGTPVSLYAFRRGGSYVDILQGNAGYGFISTVSPVGMGPFRNQTATFYFSEVVSANLAGGYHLRNRAIAAGWNGTSKIIAQVNIAAGVTVVGTAFVAGFDTGNILYPAGSVLQLINNGVIAGLGGAGGTGGSVSGHSVTGGFSGQIGYAGMYVVSPIQISNYGTIGGGGGGGGGGAASGLLVSDPKTFLTTIYGASGSGGGGGGRSGAGGAGGSITGNDIFWYGTAGAGGGANGAGVGGAGGPESGAGPSGPDGGTGGTGGALGAAGTSGGTGGSDQHDIRSSAGAGGNPGFAIFGYSNITWSPIGTILGATS